MKKKHRHDIGVTFEIRIRCQGDDCDKKISDVVASGPMRSVFRFGNSSAWVYHPMHGWFCQRCARLGNMNDTIQRVVADLRAGVVSRAE